MGKKKEKNEEELQEFDLDENTCDCQEHENEEGVEVQEQCDCEKDECEKDECECEHSCGDECECKHHGHHHKEHLQQQVQEYLAMAQRLQADFENYRKRVAEQLDFQRAEGVKSVLEVFMPCLDTFKEAKKSITDENTLAGINMIENKITEGLDKLGVKKIETIGQKYDPHLHNVVAVFKDESKDEDIILDEFQAGYTMNDKVIRYAKVVVNKLS